MIIKIFPSGTSFKGAAQYLMHDVKKDTSERVAWTHTLNCVHDDVPSAVDEMLWTFRGANLLKEEAGIRAGGARVEKPVKHFSLNWHPSESPTREQMIEAVESYVNHMGWAEHEAVLAAHSDKPHDHVHVILNRINPSDGTALDDGYDKRRSQEWAYRYERLHGQIFCEQRLLPAEEREKAPTRQAWETLQNSERQHEASEKARREFDRSYFAREENRTVIESEEWKILKAHQRDQRTAFFEEGKEAFSELRKEAYRDVRELYREEWRGFYDAKRDGRLALDNIDAAKADILDRQKKTLTEYGDEYSRLLREERDGIYQKLLADQRLERADLSSRQGEDVRSPHLLDHVNERARGDGIEPSDAFGRAAHEVCGPAYARTAENVDLGPWPDSEPPTRTRAEDPFVRDPDIASVLVGAGAIGALASIGEKLFDGFFGGDAPRPKPEVTPPSVPRPSKEHWHAVRDNPFLKVAEAARHEALRQEEEMRHRAWWEERDRGRE